MKSPRGNKMQVEFKIIGCREQGIPELTWEHSFISQTQFVKRMMHDLDYLNEEFMPEFEETAEEYLVNHSDLVRVKLDNVEYTRALKEHIKQSYEIAWADMTVHGRAYICPIDLEMNVKNIRVFTLRYGYNSICGYRRFETSEELLNYLIVYELESVMDGFKEFIDDEHPETEVLLDMVPTWDVILGLMETNANWLVEVVVGWLQDKIEDYWEIINHESAQVRRTASAMRLGTLFIEVENKV